MQDAITSLIGAYDATGKYFDRDAMDTLKSFFATGNARLAASSAITANAASIVRKAGSQLFEEVPDLIRPGGNAYTTRRFAACLRDMDYYLRYASYALVAGNNDVLDERVLQGLRDTYSSLGVPIGPTVLGIQIMKQAVMDLVGESADWLAAPFDYMSRELSEKNI
ncbi:allophycocyanin subunit beta [Pseudanabaena galeata UHCC 0370]|jgi:phycobilisome core component|uniref:Allophycocyanin subunit beta n=1 Tax=Pseudanabaena galeata UHCC 0370 TaxID=3110310 RepID=A0ABU5TH90_9CYAN|nr:MULTISPECIES: allophycocyanin subunit beta [Pseudanabaena]MEA5477617.1 allophycocyanin subunit beta [Pseudanabaena galeata UHCC 0370]MEA5486062.1 allophycocyanin subunit beta [Pseudanabaena sp. CCNP1317]WGS73062.1 allophycocyanin subunit beta [Pseudanabaena galeata CCNP1313]